MMHRRVSCSTSRCLMRAAIVLVVTFLSGCKFRSIGTLNFVDQSEKNVSTVPSCQPTPPDRKKLDIRAYAIAAGSLAVLDMWRQLQELAPSDGTSGNSDSDPRAWALRQFDEGGHSKCFEAFRCTLGDPDCVAKYPHVFAARLVQDNLPFAVSTVRRFSGVCTQNPRSLKLNAGSLTDLLNDMEVMCGAFLNQINSDLPNFALIPWVSDVTLALFGGLGGVGSSVLANGECWMSEEQIQMSIDRKGQDARNFWLQLAAQLGVSFFGPAVDLAGEAAILAAILVPSVSVWLDAHWDAQDLSNITGGDLTVEKETEDAVDHNAQCVSEPIGERMDYREKLMLADLVGFVISATVGQILGPLSTQKFWTELFERGAVTFQNGKIYINLAHGAIDRLPKNLKLALEKLTKNSRDLELQLPSFDFIQKALDEVLRKVEGQLSKFGWIKNQTNQVRAGLDTLRERLMKAFKGLTDIAGSSLQNTAKNFSKEGVLGRLTQLGDQAQGALTEKGKSGIGYIKKVLDLPQGAVQGVPLPNPEGLAERMTRISVGAAGPVTSAVVSQALSGVLPPPDPIQLEPLSDKELLEVLQALGAWNATVAFNIGGIFTYLARENQGFVPAR